MRTKTLLLTAALGVVGAATTMAQVYSVNAVGYVNVTLKPGFNMVANPLDAGAGNNTVKKLLSSLPDGSIVYKYTPGSGYSLNTYDLSGAGDWDRPDETVVPGEGFWIALPPGNNVTVTFVGDVPQGTLTKDLAKGFTMVSSKVPQAGKVATDLKLPVADGDIVYQYANPGGYSLFTYDLSGAGGWDPSEPSVAVAEGFWVLKSAAATWTRDFSVNQ